MLPNQGFGLPAGGFPNRVVGTLTVTTGVTIGTAGLTDNGGYVLNAGGGYLSLGSAGYRLNGNLGLLYATGGIMYVNSQAQPGALVTEQAAGATTDRWRIWHNGGAITAGNLLSWGHSTAYEELGAIDFNGRLKWVSGLVQSTVGAAGAASTVPASPSIWLTIKSHLGSTLVIPAFSAA